MVRQHNIECMFRKRTVLSYYADKAFELIERFDVETIEELYNLLQEGT